MKEKMNIFNKASVENEFKLISFTPTKTLVLLKTPKINLKTQL